jgi:hypothetical protein
MSDPSDPPPRDVEVARLRLPVLIRGLDQLTDYLSDAYGADLRFDSEGEWMIFWKPAVAPDQ